MVARLEEAVEETKAELVEQIDGYLNYMVEQWIDDNAVALEGAMKVELVNGFIDGMKSLFKEHYFDIPEDRLDVVEEQANEIAELRSVLEELATEHNALVNEKVDLVKAAIIEQVAEELTATEQERFVGLAENVEFTTDEEYFDKLQTIKESYFPKSKQHSTFMVDDTPNVDLTEEVVHDQYVGEMAKRIKF
jgi:hypothetical protein